MFKIHLTRPIYTQTHTDKQTSVWITGGALGLVMTSSLPEGTLAILYANQKRGVEALDMQQAAAGLSWLIKPSETHFSAISVKGSGCGGFAGRGMHQRAPPPESAR